jgi:hypothetical protein
MAKKVSQKGLITHSLEKVSGRIFTSHSSLITKLIEGRSGVYALYNGDKLYYVGKATELRRRLAHHLRDKHVSKWTHFSFYVVKDAQHIGQIESMLISIAQPKGNNVQPRDIDSKTLYRELDNLLKEQHHEERKGLLSSQHKTSKKKLITERTLEGLVNKRTTIQRNYKGVIHKAVLRPSGTITYKSLSYSSSSAAAKKVQNGRRANGWAFWSIKNSKGEWVKLRNYK